MKQTGNEVDVEVRTQSLLKTSSKQKNERINDQEQKLLQDWLCWIKVTLQMKKFVPKKMVRRKLVERLREKKKEKTRTKQSEWLGAAS